MGKARKNKINITAIILASVIMGTLAWGVFMILLSQAPVPLSPEFLPISWLFFILIAFAVIMLGAVIRLLILRYRRRGS